jgi:hypothetical protein
VNTFINRIQKLPTTDLHCHVGSARWQFSVLFATALLEDFTFFGSSQQLAFWREKMIVPDIA